jgi:selenocysteine-specific elongation factor
MDRAPAWSTDDAARGRLLVIRVIVGTAGHVDHGKTSLIQALTGVDCDRWAEEKSRGITIDLGFAHLTEGDVQLGFVDVPGHERFLHNALAGLGGIRLALLVVAADERVRAQTREHLAICALLGIPALVVALTKRDRVTGEELHLAQLEVEEFLAHSPFAGAPIVPVSSRSGEGLPLLARTLCTCARQLDAAAASLLPARLPIDRAFHLKGLGLIATGTLVAGAIRRGDVLELLPAGRECRVRNVQVHGCSRDRAKAGERVSVQLNGLERAQVARGMQLVESHVFRPAMHALAAITTLPEMPPTTPSSVWRLYLHSTDVVCRLRRVDRAPLGPQQTAVVELVPDAPIVAVRGDRFVLRHAAAQMTVAGGVVLTPFWDASARKRNRSQPPGPDAPSGDVLLAWIQERVETGISATDLAARVGRHPAAVEEELRGLMRSGAVVALSFSSGSRHPTRWISRAAYDRVKEQCRQAVEEHDRTDFLGRGMAKAQLFARFLAGIPRRISEMHLNTLEEQQVIAIERDRVTLPGRRLLNPDESSLAAIVLARLESAGLRPPSLEQLRAELDAFSPALDSALLYLEQRGLIVRISENVLCHRAAVSKLCDDLGTHHWDRFTVPQFKEHFGLTRKWAIPLLEYLDSRGITQRLGDERRLVGRETWPPGSVQLLAAVKSKRCVDASRGSQDLSIERTLDLQHCGE